MINRILYWSSILLLFSVPWEDMISLPLIGSLARMAGILMFGFWAFKLILTGHSRKLHLFHIILYFFMVWNLASILWTSGFEETKTRSITFIQLFIMTVIFWDIYRTPALLNAGLQAYVLGTWVGVFSMLYNYASGAKISAYEVARYSASGINAGDFVVIMTLGIPISWYLARFAKFAPKHPFLVLANYAYVPVAGATIFLTGSRLALFTILPGLLFVFGTIIQPRRILTSVIFLTIISGVFVFFLSMIPEATWGRLTTAKSSIQAGDLGGRVPIWRECIKAFSENPAVGVGGGAFRVVNPYKSAAHNTYLSVLAELGLIGFLLFGALLAVALISIMQQSQTETLFWLTTYAILLIGVSVQTWEFTKTTYIILSFMVIGANFLNQTTAAEIKPFAAETI